jgi:uracil phosphoribosyltransferase
MIPGRDNKNTPRENTEKDSMYFTQIPSSIPESAVFLIDSLLTV